MFFLQSSLVRLVKMLFIIQTLLEDWGTGWTEIYSPASALHSYYSSMVFCEEFGTFFCHQNHVRVPETPNVW